MIRAHLLLSAGCHSDVLLSTRLSHWRWVRSVTSWNNVIQYLQRLMWKGNQNQKNIFQQRLKPVLNKIKRGNPRGFWLFVPLILKQNLSQYPPGLSALQTDVSHCEALLSLYYLLLTTNMKHGNLHLACSVYSNMQFTQKGESPVL